MKQKQLREILATRTDCWLATYVNDRWLFKELSVSEKLSNKTGAIVMIHTGAVLDESDLIKLTTAK